jgi:uncharacterized membrane protein
MKKFLQKYSIFILILLFGLLYSLWVVNRHNHFLTDAVDLGIYDQPIWNLSQFRPPFSSIKNMWTWGDHVGWVILLLAPFYWLWSDTRVLLLLQVWIVVIAAWPIYQLAKSRLKNEFASLSIAFVFLSFVGLQTALDYDFHLATLSVMPIAFTLYFMHQQKWTPYWLWFFIGMATKEDVPLIMLMVGLYVLVVLRKYKIGLTSVLIAGIYYWVLTNKIIPYFKGGPFNYEQFDPSLGIGTTTGELLMTALTRQWKILQVLVTPSLKIKTTANLVGSYAFLPLLSPATFLLSAPIWAERFLNGLSQRWLIRFQYSASIDPILAVGTILGMENVLKIKNKFVKRISSGQIIIFLSVIILAMNIFVIWRTNGPMLRILDPKSYPWQERFDINYELIRQIPPDASVVAQSCFVPHLSHREKIYRFQEGIVETQQPDYVLLGIDEHSDPPYVEEQWQNLIADLKAMPEYEILYDDGRRFLFKRKS